MIWKCRNQVVHEGRVFYVAVEDLIRSLVKVFNEHWSCIKTRTVSPSSARLLIWQKPAQDQLKMYCDAAVGMEHSYVAVVVRDWRRTLVFTWSKKVNTKVPVQAEAKAFLWAVQLASQMHFKKVIIEGDSKNCVELVTNSSVSVHWRIANFVDEVKLLSVSFDKLEFMWVYRNCIWGCSCLGKVVSIKLLS